MVVSAEVIRSQQVFHVAWVLGTGDMRRKLSKKEVLCQNLPDICDSIIELVPERGVGSSKKAGLYVLSMLTYGTVLIHRVQVDFLQKDVEKLKEIVRKKSFVMVLAEKFDRELELNNKQKEKRDGKMRSEPIPCIEDIDEFVNLENLQMISEQLGINVDPREITMLDALPNFQSDWYQSGDFAALYGLVGQLSSEKENFPIHSTFVEGRASDERKGDIVSLLEDIQVPPKELSREESSRRRSSLVAPEDAPNQIEGLIKSSNPEKEAVGEDPKDKNADETHQLIQNETLQFAQCLLSSSLAQELPQEVENPPDAHPAFRFEELLGVPNTPANLQEKELVVPEEVSTMPERTIPLPPPVHGSDLSDLQPPAKKQRLNDGEEDEEDESEMERARKRASSRPVTPVNRTDLTNLNTTVHPESPFLEIDSQVHGELPQKKRPKRNLPPIYGDDLEIDVAVQKALLADWSSLVRRREEIMPKNQSKYDQTLVDMQDPAPVFTFGKRMNLELRGMFRSGLYRGDIGTGVSSDEEESDEEEDQRTMEQEKFAQSCLLLSPYRYPEEQRPLRVDELDFEFPLRPVAPELEPIKYAAKCLLATPEKHLQEEIMKDLELEPMPRNNIELIDFSHQQQTLQHNEDTTGLTVKTTENVEAARRHKKSSLGIRCVRADELEDDDEHRARVQQQEEQMRNAIEDEELFVFSSGPLLLHNRRQIHRELLEKAESVYPDWMDFNQFTTKYSRKEATTSFEGLLLSLKNLKVRVKQEDPFGTIFVQHIREQEEEPRSSL